MNFLWLIQIPEFIFKFKNHFLIHLSDFSTPRTGYQINRDTGAHAQDVLTLSYGQNGTAGLFFIKSRGFYINWAAEGGMRTSGLHDRKWTVRIRSRFTSNRYALISVRSEIHGIDLKCSRSNLGHGIQIGRPTLFRPNRFLKI
jgi:hypothetical protein